MSQRPPVLEYTRLSTPGPPRLPWKNRVMIVGWCLVAAPMLVSAFVGVVISLANIVTPGRGRRLVRFAILPTGDGRGVNVFNLVLYLALGGLLVAFLWQAIRKSRLQK